MAIRAEYIWIDGSEPTQKLRAKTKVLFNGDEPPIWGFDGSSTNQAPGNQSDCVLSPVKIVPDPIRGGDDVLVLPSAASAAPRIGAGREALNALREVTLGMTAVAGLTGRPALSVPLAMTDAAAGWTSSAPFPFLFLPIGSNPKPPLSSPFPTTAGGSARCCC